MPGVNDVKNEIFRNAAKWERVNQEGSSRCIEGSSRKDGVGQINMECDFVEVGRS